MTKVTIANYLIGNLSNRFPFVQTDLLDHNIIEVMVDGWQKNQYQTPDFNVWEEHKRSPQRRLLM
ncbi:MAG: hypothetical protein IJ660_04900 [Alphaproteobacteria bacterium]|nr:hypothetical protein [Alphaproteobacteria bacterium]